MFALRENKVYLFQIDAINSNNSFLSSHLLGLIKYRRLMDGGRGERDGDAPMEN